jgi:O-antigen/teichoic acid export membrane protein
VRILALAGAIALLTNVLGMVLIARATVRPLLIGCTLAMMLNVGGNLLLVPRYGVAAAAWLTVVTELVVAAVELWILRGSLAPATALSASWRPALAVAGFVATGLTLGAWPLLGIPSAATVFVLLVLALRAWPSELALPGWQAIRS